MDEPVLDVSLLNDALSQFRLFLGDYDSHPGERAYRDSVVIHFVIVYNLAVQTIFRFVQLQSGKSKHSKALTLSRAVRRALDLGGAALRVGAVCRIRKGPEQRGARVRHQDSRAPGPTCPAARERRHISLGIREEAVA